MDKSRLHRSKILACARELYNKDGAKAVTISAIVCKCRISKATLYSVFPSKEELIEQLKNCDDNNIGAINTKDEIIEKAIEEFSKHGYTELSMEIVAKAVGMKRASLYRYFASKEELLEYFIQYDMKKRHEIFLSEKTDLKDPYKVLNKFAEYSCNRLKNSFTRLMISYSRYLACKSEKIKEQLNNVMLDRIRLIAETFETGKKKGIFRTDFDSEAVASIIVSYFNGLIYDPSADYEAITGTFCTIMANSVINPNKCS